MTSDPYYSRCGSSEEIAARLAPVVWGNEQGPLGEEQLQHYRERGFLVLPSLWDATDVDRFRNEAERLSDDQPIASSDATVREPGDDTVRSVFHPHKHSPVFAGMINDARIRDRARQILANDVYVHQFRINYKPAFAGRDFPWHSDFETWHVEDGMPRMRALSVVVMLEQNNQCNGPLMVIPGSHRHYVRCAGKTPEDHFRSSLRRQEYGVPSHSSLRQLAGAGGLECATGEPGDVVFFDCNLMHASASNLSPYPRTNAFIVYNSCDNELVEPFGGRTPRPEFLGERRSAE